MAGSDRDEAIGQAVAGFREPKSQEWVADLMRHKGHKWSQATVWGVEKGRRPLKLTEAIDLAQILGCEVEDFRRSPLSVLNRAWLNRVGSDLIRRQMDLEDAAVLYERAADAVHAAVEAVRQGEPSDEDLELARVTEEEAAVTAAEAVSRPLARARGELAMTPTIDEIGEGRRGPREH